MKRETSVIDFLTSSSSVEAQKPLTLEQVFFHFRKVGKMMKRLKKFLQFLFVLSSFVELSHGGPYFQVII